MFRDRVTGKTVQALPPAVEHGRYVALVETVAEPVQIPAGRHVTGVPGCLLQAPLPVELDGVPPADSDAARKLLQLAELERLDDPAGIYPLVGEMTRGVTLSPPELMLGELVPTLFDVCHRPNARLVSVEEVVWLARVKRLAARGETWIDGHPEGWTGWQRGLPMPSRAPASQPESDVDVYENRVTARLIDRRLLPKLNARITELRNKKPATERFGAATHAHHLLQWRLRELWDQWAVANVQQFQDQIDETLGELEARAMQVRRLRHTPLYRGVPRNGSVPAVLRQTNVLRGDARYRRVGELWDAFRIEPQPTPEERARTAEQLVVGHARFTRVLVARALRELDWDRPGSPQHVLVEEAGEGNVCLRAADAAPLQVIPLLFAGSSAALAERLPALRDTLVVHAHREDEPASGLAERIGETWFVATSPLDLSAVEVVGYAIHNHVLQARYGALPPQATLSDRLADLVQRLHLVERSPHPGGARYVVPQPLAELDLELDGELERSVRRGPEAQAFERDLAGAGAQLRAADGLLRRVLACPHPHCYGSGRVVTHSRERYLVECTVGDCGARWGVQACSRCSRLLPFFTLGDMPTQLAEAVAHEVLGAQAVFGMLALGELVLAGQHLAVLCSCGHAQPVSVQRKQ